RRRDTLPHRGGAKGRQGPEAVHIASLPRGGGRGGGDRERAVTGVVRRAERRQEPPLVPHVPRARSRWALCADGRADRSGLSRDPRTSLRATAPLTLAQ